MAELEKLASFSEVPPIDDEADQRILEQLTPVVVPLINRHIDPKRFSEDPEYRDEFPTVTKYMGDNSDQWTPAMLVPWSLGENFPVDYVWSPEESPLPDVATKSLRIGLLTEDALPWYSEAILRKFGSNEGLNFYARVWTGEEDCHADTIKGYSTVARLLDPIQLERDRTENMITHQTPDPPSAMESLVYVAIQELATRISHLNTGKLIADTAKDDEAVVALSEDRTTLANVEPLSLANLEPEQRASYIRQVARTLFTRIAGDENKHYVFYRDTVKNGVLELDPSTGVKAIERQVRKFDMPGTGIPEFWSDAVVIADAGVYDPPIHHGTILTKLVLGHWGLESIQGLDDEAEQARERTLIYLRNMGKIAAEFDEQREERRAKLIDDPTAIWVGKAPV